MNDFFTVIELAKFFKVCPKTTYRLAEKKDLPGVKAGGRWRFIKSEVDQWLRWRKR